MAKIASTGARFILENLAAAPPTPKTATGCTKAKPAVVTLSAVTGLASGDVVRITGSGWKSIDGIPFTVGVVAASTVELLGSNTTAEVPAWVATASLVEPNITDICLATFSRTTPAAASIDVTTLCDTSRKKVGGLADTGTFTFDGYWDSTDPGYIALLTASLDQKERLMGVIMSDKSAMYFQGQITGMGESVGVDQAVTFTGTGSVNSAVSYSGVPPAGMTMMAEPADAPAPEGQPEPELEEAPA